MTSDEEILQANKKLLNIASVECRIANKEIDKLKAIYKLWRDLNVSSTHNSDDDYILANLVISKKIRGLCPFVGWFSTSIDGAYNCQLMPFHDRLLKEYLRDYIFPFGYNDYQHRTQEKTQYLNPERIKWVDRVLSGEFDDFKGEENV